MSTIISIARLPHAEALLCFSRSTLPALWIAASTLLLAPLQSPAQQTKNGDWLSSNDPVTNNVVLTREISVPAVAPPRPALSVRFIPDDYDRVEGNSALFYLKATGFFEQTNAQQKLQEIYQQASEKANAADKPLSELPPWVWLETPPDELPVEEMREFLALTAFQPPFLREAVKRRGFTMDRNIGEVDNPISYLLPEIQQFRSTARTQCMRTRLALAEGRIDDAIEIVGQQFAMAGHLCQDDFLVSGLVGIAIHGIAWEDALYLAEHADAPNLYWAYASLPANLVDMNRADAFERNVLYEQIKVLKEVNENPRSVGYWNDFIDRLAPQLKGLEMEGLAVLAQGESAEVQRLKLISLIGAAYPSARRYLIEDEGMDVVQVDAYPTTQVVMLALCKFHNYMRDEIWKWKTLPYHAAIAADGFKQAERKMQSQSERLGLTAAPAVLFLPAMQAVVRAEQRAYEKIAMAQTVASLQAYAAANDGRLPRALDNLPLPVPLAPQSGKPLNYELSGGRAILSGAGSNPMYRLIIEIAK